MICCLEGAQPLARAGLPKRPVCRQSRTHPAAAENVGKCVLVFSLAVLILKQRPLFSIFGMK
jgi:hypothetical protein